MRRPWPPANKMPVILSLGSAISGDQRAADRLHETLAAGEQQIVFVDRAAEHGDTGALRDVGLIKGAWPL